jgi:signal transduction histidine kinase
MFASLKSKIKGLSLAQQLIAGSVVLLFGCASIMGFFVTNWIEKSLTQDTAQYAAKYMEQSIGPNVQQLSESQTLTTDRRKALDDAVNSSFNRDNIMYLQIWNVGGTIVYSTLPSMVGTTYALSSNFRRALEGRISAEFDNPPHVSDVGDGKSKERLIEIYWPLRDFSTGHIIAVAEFYVKGDMLHDRIWQIRNYSWFLRFSLVVVIVVAFGFFVRRAARIITNQQAQLRHRIDELQELLRQNEVLRKSLRETSINITEVSERITQRLGADLHDGPAQLLTYVLLRFDRCVAQLNVDTDQSRMEELRSMRSMLEDTLREVRSLSVGLSLPGLNSRTLSETIRLAVDHHVRTTNTDVEVQIGDLPDTADHNLKTCVYRLIQEGLTNAFHHAGAMGQAVYAEWGEGLKISVCDKGPGFSLERTQSRLGLFGLRARVEACGGTLQLASAPGKGVRLAAHFEIG